MTSKPSSSQTLPLAGAPVDPSTSAPTPSDRPKPEAQPAAAAPATPAASSPPAPEESTAPAPGSELALRQESELTKELATKDERGSMPMGLAPRTLAEAWRMAKFFAASNLVPKDFRGRPADCLLAIQFGLEVGLAPFTAIQSVAVINGRPGIWGDGLMALVMSSPLYVDHEEFYLVNGQRIADEDLTAEHLTLDRTAACCTFWRKNKALPVTRKFSVADALKANLLGRGGASGKDGPWRTYPTRMLRMRARGFAARDAFPDLLRGIHAAEELLELPAEEAPRQVERLSASAASSTSTPAPADTDPRSPAP